MKADFILELYKKPQTVFTFKEISLLFPEASYQSLKNKIRYAIRTEKLHNPRRGIYTKDKFNRFELANKIYAPSYISLETILQEKGIVFQKYATIFVASYLTRKIKVAGEEISYRKLKDEVLLNKKGIEEKNAYFCASAERAFLDAVFLYKDYHFDNLNPLDWKKVAEFKKIYQSKTLEKRVEQYYQIYKKEYA